MKKTTIVSFIVLMALTLICAGCGEAEVVHIGILSDVDTVSYGGLFGGYGYLVAFKDGKVYKISSQPKNGFGIGKIYEVLHGLDGFFLRLKEE